MKDRGVERIGWIALVVLALGVGGWWSPRAAPVEPTPATDPAATDPPAADPLAAAPAPDPPSTDPPVASGEVSLRVLAANLTSGRRQSYDPGHGGRILKALKPDVVLIQEFNCGGNGDADVRRFVDETFGSGFHYVRESGAEIPNGVISRWPIRASGVWEDTKCPNREFVWARIDVPGSIDLWAISLHLLTRNASTRDFEARELVGFVRENIPEADYLVIGGDLNAKHDGEQVLRTLGAVVSTKHVPVDHTGRAGTNASRKRPYDQVLPDGDLEAHHVPVLLGGRTYEHGLVFDSRVFRPLPAGVERGDSGAEQMQHMAVVKDFRIPGD